MAAPPLSTSYALTGTAADYVLRICAEQYGNIVKQDWICYAGLNMLCGQYGYAKFQTPNDGASYPIPEYNKEYANLLYQNNLLKTDDLAQIAIEYFKDGIREYNEFQQTNIITNNLLASCVRFARLDSIVRSNGWISAKSFDVSPDIIKDLYNIYLVAQDSGVFKFKQGCLNPTFGAASDLVGGADADFILDNRLIDIKTTKYPTMTQDMWNQILGYYVLANIQNPENQITEIGIYFSRHGVLKTFDVSNFDLTYAMSIFSNERISV